MAKPFEATSSDLSRGRATVGCGDGLRDRRGYVLLCEFLASALGAPLPPTTGFARRSSRVCVGRVPLSAQLLEYRRTIFVIAHHVLRNRVPCENLGADYFDRMKTTKLNEAFPCAASRSSVR